MTTNTTPFAYLNCNYSRTYPKWTALALLWVPECALGECMMLFALRDFRCSARHELVMAQDDVILHAFDDVSTFFFKSPDQHRLDLDRAQRDEADREEAKQAAQEVARRQRHRQEQMRAACLREERQRMKEEEARLQAEKGALEAKRQPEHEEEQRLQRQQCALNAVQAFVCNTLEKGEPKDFIKVKELYNEYSEAYRVLQKDKETYKNNATFQTLVTQVLKKDAFVSKHHHYTSQGNRTIANSVLLGYKRKRADLN